MITSDRCQWEEDGQCEHPGRVWVLDLWLCLLHARIVIAIRETVIAEKEHRRRVTDAHA